ncbi:hypothetical protein [Sporosarcina sp. NPDC096371]|uniref:hypothetical protein n=1 Tax=Sporosarcina sp. NPDC096371 TaxID=3364530 RepID=UPI0037F5ABE3
MNKWLLVVLAFVGLNLMGCSNNDISGEKPPKVFIGVGDDTYETKLGTYCWGNTCVDTAGSIEMLADKEPIEVSPGETLSLVMDYEPKPNEFYVVQVSGEEETDVTVQDSRFNAPTEQGIYYYTYGAWWKDEEVENLSRGDAFYAFALEVVP